MGKVVTINKIRVVPFDMVVALAIQFDGMGRSFRWRIETLTNQINVK